MSLSPWIHMPLTFYIDDELIQTWQVYFLQCYHDIGSTVHPIYRMPSKNLKHFSALPISVSKLRSFFCLYVSMLVLRAVFISRPCVFYIQTDDSGEFRSVIKRSAVVCELNWFLNDKSFLIVLISMIFNVPKGMSKHPLVILLLQFLGQETSAAVLCDE